MQLTQRGCVTECFEHCSVSICLSEFANPSHGSDWLLVLLVFGLLFLSGPVCSRSDLQLRLQSSTNILVLLYFVASGLNKTFCSGYANKLCNIFGVVPIDHKTPRELISSNAASSVTAVPPVSSMYLQHLVEI